MPRWVTLFCRGGIVALTGGCSQCGGGAEPFRCNTRSGKRTMHLQKSGTADCRPRVLHADAEQSWRLTKNRNSCMEIVWQVLQGPLYISLANSQR